MNNKHLIVSETFYSIQGEGPCVGVPAVFLRLAGCNLRCNGFSYKDPETGKHLGCDTKKVWQKGIRKTFRTILDDWKQQGWFDALKNGAHLVITGGEPMIQHVPLAEFISLFDEKIGVQVYIEMETNATIPLNDYLLQRINQVNASPKLSHSGEPRDKAYIKDVLKTYVDNDRAIFKFVIAKESDIEEVIESFIGVFKIDRSRVWLMPEGGCQRDMQDRQGWLIERCKHYVFNFSTRLHINVWDEATGV